MPRQSTVHLFSALPAGADAAPEWVHLVPAGTFSGADGRGPYTLADPAAVIAASMATGKLVLDENHATDLAAPQGRPSPARGWIVEMASRGDGLWGRVEWTAAGTALIAERAYRGISPALGVDEGTGRVVRVMRASLVNDPNLRLAHLHQQQDPTHMDLLAELRALLGLAEDADAAAVIGAVKGIVGQKDGAALQAQIRAIAKAAGAAEDADAATVLNAVTALADPARRVPASEVKELQAHLATLTQAVARDKAVAAVDAAIAAGKPGVKALREHYIARHMADQAAVEKELAGLPSLTQPSGARPTPPPRQPGEKVELNAAQAAAVRVLGLKPEDYATTLSAEEAAEQETI